MYAGVNLPWLLMGDFNSVLSTSDRVGGTVVNMTEIVDFQECVEKCGLVELPHQGSRYSWTDRQSENRVLFKIDWVFINTTWLNTMPAYSVCYMPEGISNHCPMKLQVLGAERMKRPTFKYCNVWSKHPKFLEIVKEGWSVEVVGCKMLQIVRKLKLLKKSLRKLNKQYF